MLALVIFYEKRTENNSYRVLICVIYTIIKNYVCNNYLACQSKALSEIPVGYEGSSKHGDKTFEIILGIGIPYLLMNLMYWHGFLKNMNSVVILNYPKKILEYYFLKVFTILECNDNNFA